MNFRSEEMSFYELRLPIENSWKLIRGLGQTGYFHSCLNELENNKKNNLGQLRIETSHKILNLLKKLEEMAKEININVKDFDKHPETVKSYFNQLEEIDGFEIFDSDSGIYTLLKQIEEKLLTPFGLRSLSEDNPNYKNKCVGNFWIVINHFFFYRYSASLRGSVIFG